MEYAYTHVVGVTPNKVKSITDPSLKGSEVLSIKYEEYFPWGSRVTFLPNGEGGWVPTPPYAQTISTTQGYPLTSIKPCLYKTLLSICYFI